MRLARALLCSLVGVSLLSCSDATSPTEPGPAVATAPAAPFSLISDAAHAGGNAHFFWLPPMVAQPSEFNGPFDGSKSPVVRICDLANCAAPWIAEFTMGAGVTVGAEHYQVDWHTGDYSVSPGPTYRIAVTVSGTELGFADIEFGENGKEARNLMTDETIGLTDGRTLPIKFRIEEGAVFVVSPADGGTVEALGGTTTLEIPAGAVSEETGITVAEVPPSGTALTSVEFGPAGLEFTEPVIVTLAYDPATIPPGLDEEDLALNLLDDQGRWIVLPGSTVDEVTHEVSAPFFHFSTGGAGAAELAIFCPGDGVPETFETMAEAVDAVMEGGTIEVCDGTHTVAGVTIDKGLTIEGASGVRPTLTTAGAPIGLDVGWELQPLTDPVTVRNLRLITDYGVNSSGATILRLGDRVGQAVVEDVDVEVVFGGSGIFVRNGQVPGSTVLIQNASFTGGPAFGRNGLYLRHDGDGSTVEVRNSTFHDLKRDILIQAGQVTDSRTIVDNVTATGGEQLGVWALGADPLVDVLNSSFTGKAVLLQNGASGLVQNNVFTGCPIDACIQVAGGGQQEPTRIIGNQMSPSGTSGRAIFLSELDAGPFEVTDNVIGGVTHGGNRSDPADYTFSEGISFLNLAVSGDITGNTISGTFVSFVAEGGVGTARVNDNSASASWSPLNAVNGATMTAHSNDFTDYLSAIDPSGPFAAGALTCNWWGAATGPTGVDASIASNVFTPWATTPVAGTSTTTCSGGL
jgi:hypothetical protein